MSVTSLRRPAIVHALVTVEQGLVRQLLAELGRDLAKAPLPPRVVVERREEVLSVKVWPHRLREIELGVGDLPEEEIDTRRSPEVRMRRSMGGIAAVGSSA